jgi:hypothetical protein
MELIGVAFDSQAAIQAATSITWFTGIIFGGLLAVCLAALALEWRPLRAPRSRLPAGSEFMGFGGSQPRS